MKLLDRVYASKNLMCSVLACIASSFKSVTTTMTALDMDEIQALQFILDYVTHTNRGSEVARQFIKKLISEWSALPLHILLCASHGHIGVLRYVQCCYVHHMDI